jgi:hypothetical protein
MHAEKDNDLWARSFSRFSTFTQKQRTCPFPNAPGMTSTYRRFGAAEHEGDEGPKTASPALQNMRLGPDSSHCLRAANPDNQWDAIGFLVQPRAKFHVTQISRFRAQEFWKKMLQWFCRSVELYHFKSQSSKNQSPKTLILSHLTVNLSWYLLYVTPLGTSVLLSHVCRMFQCSSPITCVHLSAYSKNVILHITGGDIKEVKGVIQNMIFAGLIHGRWYEFYPEYTYSPWIIPMTLGFSVAAHQIYLTLPLRINRCDSDSTHPIS